jgi:hypothetical protein
MRTIFASHNSGKLYDFFVSTVNGWLPKTENKQQMCKNRKYTYTVLFRGVFKLLFYFGVQHYGGKGKSSTFMKRNARTRNDAKICGYLNRLLQYFIKLTSLLILTSSSGPLSACPRLFPPECPTPKSMYTFLAQI